MTHFTVRTAISKGWDDEEKSTRNPEFFKWSILPLRLIHCADLQESVPKAPPSEAKPSKKQAQANTTQAAEVSNKSNVIMFSLK